MELTTFNERMQTGLEDRFGGNFQVTGFYGETNKNIGAYFGINDKSNYVLTQGDPFDATTSNAIDFDLGYIIHQCVYIDNPTPVTVQLDPKSEAYGARFDYYQNMDKLLKGLYLKVNTTVVHVENNMELNIPDSSTAGMPQNVLNFLHGKYANTTQTSGNLQSLLTYGKMTGERSQTGLADVDVILGYKFIEKTKYHAGINIAVTIPTGNDADGRVMFEPVYGNHSHFGLGGGIDTHLNLWTKGERNIKINLVANYRYLFDASEHRPLKLKNYDSPYVLLGQNAITSGSINVALIPAVNVLTPYGVEVTPGSQFDGVLALAYNCGGFSADLGYNVYARSEEDVDLKGTLTPSTYAVASRIYDTQTAFGATPEADIDGAPTDVTATAGWLSNSDIDTEAATTPSQFTNGIYGGLGYHFKKWEYPFLMGIGGKYDWASKNSEIDSWSVWGKLALSF
jgi:hypothetical protein